MARDRADVLAWAGEGMVMHHDLCPEIQLLLCSGYVRMDGTVDADMRLQLKTILEGPIDWDGLIEMALHHRMLPLLQQTLSSTCREWVPAPMMDRLQEMAIQVAVRNVSLTRELLSLLELLQAHDIEALTFKGPTLTSLLYGNLTLRLFGDLDILVHPRDVWRARELLLTRGYERRLISENQTSDADIWRYGYAFYLGHETRQTFVDLHWALGGVRTPFPLALAPFWRDHQATSLLGTSVKTFRPEDLLIYLCVHGGKHCWHKLGWICDVAMLLRREPALLNHNLMDRVQTSGVERMFLLGLRAAQAYFGVPLPEAIGQKAMADSTVQSLLVDVHEHLFNPSREAPGCVGPRLQMGYLQLRMRERFRDQKPLFLATLHHLIRPTALDRQALPLPLWASYLYYLVRPVRLLQQHGWRWCKQIAKRFNPAVPS